WTRTATKSEYTGRGARCAPANPSHTSRRHRDREDHGGPTCVLAGFASGPAMRTRIALSE
ncbi:hypothetical protein ABT086_38355, partial [Streptomyces mirabilis]